MSVFIPFSTAPPFLSKIASMLFFLYDSSFLLLTLSHSLPSFVSLSFSHVGIPLPACLNTARWDVPWARKDRKQGKGNQRGYIEAESDKVRVTEV